jgi:hypothetical protein
MPQFEERLEAACEELIKLGVVVDSGKRLNGQIVWAPNPKLTEQQRQALIESATGADPEQDPRLAALYCAHELKFAEICAALAIAHGADPENIFGTLAVDQIIEEAEELVENWRFAARGSRDLETKTKLQRLLAEHHKIGLRIDRIEECEHGSDDDEKHKEYMRRFSLPDGKCMQCGQPADRDHPIGPIVVTYSDPDEDERTHEFCGWECFGQWAAEQAGGDLVIDADGE